jgi:hypothetical protein
MYEQSETPPGVLFGCAQVTRISWMRWSGSFLRLVERRSAWQIGDILTALGTIEILAS